MITYEEIVDFAVNLPYGSYDKPFEGDFYTTVLRRKDNNKWFGIVLKAPAHYFERYGVAAEKEREVLNLKCPPDLQEFLRQKYPKGVFPSYHMNKRLWISVVTGEEIEKDEVKALIKLSYDFTASGKKPKEKG